MKDSVRILSGSAGIPLADSVCKLLKTERCNAVVGRHNDGEINVQVLETVRGKDVYIVNPTQPPLENAFELVLLSQAIRPSAASITLIIPYLGYNRADRRDKSRVPISAKLMAELIMLSEADRVVLMDVHSEPTVGFFDCRRVERFYSSYMLIPYLRDIIDDNTVFGSPDAGGVSRVKAYGSRLGIREYVVFFKSRPAPGEIDKEGMIRAGEVRGKKVVLIDDILDTAGSTIEAAKAAISAGAAEVVLCITPGLFSKDAIQKLLKAQKEGVISELIVTDSIPRSDGFFPKELNIKVISISEMLAESSKRLETGEELSALFVEDEYHISQELTDIVSKCPHYTASGNGCGRADCLAGKSGRCSVKTWEDLRRCEEYWEAQRKK